MRDAEKTVGNMIDKEKTIFVGSVDAEGFPNIKAMLQTRKREGIKHIYLSTNTSSMRVSQFLKNNRALRLQHTLLQGRNAARHDGDTDGQHQ